MFVKITGLGSTGEGRHFVIGDDGTLMTGEVGAFTLLLTEDSVTVSTSLIYSGLFTSSPLTSTNGLEFGYTKKGLVALLGSEINWVMKGLVDTKLSLGVTERDMNGVGDRADGV